jgi:uncharacterized repeat protein (TIGR03803 family)
LLALLLAASLLAASPAAGQTLQVLTSFEAPLARPLAPLVQGLDGNFYGTTTLTGTGDGYSGAIFKMSPAGDVTPLHWFLDFECIDCEKRLVQGSDGNFYGTAPYGGAEGKGTAFRISPSGVFTTLHSFPRDGGYPYAGLTLGRDGNFYGATAYGFSKGTIFRMSPSGLVTTLHSFTGTDGEGPLGELVEGFDGYFYGTTYGGGAFDQGSIFRITPSGILTTLHSFSVTDGAHPRAGLIEAPDGNLYGVSPEGGANGAGTIFRLARDGTLTTLHSFTGADGGYPYGALILGRDGLLYGVADSGGSNDRGTVFRISISGVFAILHDFSSTEGSSPFGALVQGSDGDFYGTTVSGGSNASLGTVFKVTAGGALTTLHRFSLARVDGSSPSGVLVPGTDGSWYGTTEFGGPNGWGTLFNVASSGELTTLYSFAGYPDNTLVGSQPSGALVVEDDGTLYGTTQYGGESAFGGGTIFKLAPGGTLENLYSFSGPDGKYPVAGLTKASDGNYYGTTTWTSGANQDGTLFRMTPAGVVTTLHAFNGTDGSRPGALIQASDGNLYGTTYGGGAYGLGTVFRITPSGTLTTLYSFHFPGANPVGLVQARDGDLYGVTKAGDSWNRGTVFRITTAGALTTLHLFTGDEDGWPLAGVIQGRDDAFYGVTPGGGPGMGGTIFRITSSGTLTTLHAFTGIDGSTPEQMLRLGEDGSIYGTTKGGGPRGGGVIFKLTLPSATAQVSGGGTICEGASAVISADLTGVAPWSLVWSDGMTQTGIMTSPAQRLVAPSATTLYTAVVSDTNGPGASSGGALVTVNALTPHVTAPATVGAGSPNRPASISAIPGAAYSWTITNGVITAGQGTNQIVFTAGAAGTPVTLNVEVTYATCPAGHGSAVVAVAPGGQATQFYTLSPCRLVDTRAASGPLGGPSLVPGPDRSFPVAGVCGIPTGASSISVNVTAVQPSAAGELAFYAGDGAPTGTSAISFSAGRTRANNAIVRLATDGSGTIKVTDRSAGPVHVVVDVNGYFQ